MTISRFATPAPSYVRSPVGALPAYRPPDPTPFPLVLQRRAKLAVRKHMGLGIVRVLTLAATDAAALIGLRAILVVVRDYAVLGGWVARAAAVLFAARPFQPAAFIVPAVVGMAAVGAYGPGDNRRDFAAILSGATLGATLLYWGRLWSDFSAPVVVAYLIVAAVTGATLVLERQLVDLVVRRVRGVTYHVARTLVIGTPEEAERAMRQPPLSVPGEHRIVGFVDVSPFPAAEALGGVSDLVVVVEQERVDTIVLAGDFEHELFVELLHFADVAGCCVLALPNACRAPEFEPTLVWRRGAPLIQLTRPALRGQQLAMKRAVDFAAGAAAIVVLAPLLAVIALAVRMGSPGAVFFRQTRVGRGGRHFKIWKFRTMVADAEARRDELASDSIYRDGRLFKLPSDPRVTRLGRFLRRTSLDELPQLLNVIRGEMAIVGPRPPLPSEVALYEEHHYTRFHMKPGITGPWQVGGRNRVTDFEEVVRLETAYMRRWSIWKDFEIVLRTVPVVLRMDGAH